MLRPLRASTGRAFLRFAAQRPPLNIGVIPFGDRMSEPNQYEREVLSNRFRFIIFSCLSVALPLSILLGSPIPEGEPFDMWFQRSGATMVVFAILAEARASQMYTALRPSGMVDKSFKEVKEKYWWQATAANSCALLLVAVGTVIWGYGDMLVD